MHLLPSWPESVEREGDDIAQQRGPLPRNAGRPRDSLGLEEGQQQSRDREHRPVKLPRKAVHNGEQG